MLDLNKIIQHETLLILIVKIVTILNGDNLHWEVNNFM